MDVFLAPLSLIFSHHAPAWLLQIMNRLAQKYIHSGFTFVIKQPLKSIAAGRLLYMCTVCNNRLFLWHKIQIKPAGAGE